MEPVTIQGENRIGNILLGKILEMLDDGTSPKNLFKSNEFYAIYGKNAIAVLEEVRKLRSRVEELEAKLAKAETPNMFWDNDYPEISLEAQTEEDAITEITENWDDGRFVGEKSTLKIWQAHRFKNAEIPLVWDGESWARDSAAATIDAARREG